MSENIHNIEVGDWVRTKGTNGAYKVTEVSSQTFSDTSTRGQHISLIEEIVFKHNAVVLTEEEVKFIGSDGVSKWCTDVMQGLAKRCKAALKQEPEYPPCPMEKIHGGRWNVKVNHELETATIGCQDFTWSKYIEIAEWTEHCLHTCSFEYTRGKYNFNRQQIDSLTYTLMYGDYEVSIFDQQTLANYLRECQRIKRGES